MSKRYLSFLLTVFLWLPAWATDTPSLAPGQLYKDLHAFQLSPNAFAVKDWVLKRDRVVTTFTGIFVAETPVAGGVRGLVFEGEGSLQAAGWSDFEKESIKRFLKTDSVNVNFTHAVLRFTDDSYDLVAKKGTPLGTQTERFQQLASELEPRLNKETGINLSSRLAGSLLNHETPGVFFGEFSGGKVGRFALLLDHQARMPGSFGINGGEKGMLFQNRGVLAGNDIWTTFYDDDDFRKGRVEYSDVFNLVDTPEYRMNLDVREAGHWLRGTMEIDLVAKRDGVQMVPFSLNEGLPDYEDLRLKKGVKVLEVGAAAGPAVELVNDPWEAGFSLAFARPLAKGEKVTVRLRTVAEHAYLDWQGAFHYPLSTETWYPRHGYLERSKFDLTFWHRKKSAVISVGTRKEENQAMENGAFLETRWVTELPASFIAFAVGPYELHSEVLKLGERKVPVEFYSVPGGYLAIKEDFVVAELMNGVNFYNTLFGDYPYSRLGAAFFPAGFGQGFPTMLLLPVNGTAGLREYAFMAHEEAHQWWGNLVAWRSYRDQWLSEGFAEYSAALYSARRDNPKHALDLVKKMRRALEFPPYTDVGVGKGKLYEVGPIIMGTRLESRESGHAYTAMTYDKGALVLRMLHFLLTNPPDGDDKPFYAMMKDFVERYRMSTASTEDFFRVASEHFAATPLGKKFGLKDLNWFLQQWVYSTGMPKYRLDYHLQAQANGTALLEGTVTQENVPDSWFMPLPLLLEFGGGKGSRGTVYAMGHSTPVKITLPMMPTKVKLDPDEWVLSSKTEENQIK